MNDFDPAYERRSKWNMKLLNGVFMSLLFLIVMLTTMAVSLYFMLRTTPTELYHQVWAQVADDLYDQDKLANWRQWEHRFDNQIRTRQDAIEFANQMLKTEIHDGYTSLNDISGVTQPLLPGWDISTGIVVAPLLDSRLRPASDGHGKFLCKGSADGFALIEEVVAGSPADKAGLRCGDAILSIDGKSTAGQDFRKINRWLQLPEQRPAELVVRTAGGDKSCALERVRVFRQTVFGKILAGNIGYLRWTNFMDDGIEKAVETELAKLDSCKGLIVDLRGNDGGAVLRAIYMVSMFLEDGLVTITRQKLKGSSYQKTVYSLESDKFLISEEKTGGTAKQYRSERAVNMLGERPLIILVNGRTASASELFAGALKDNGKAVIVGTSTLGKGVGFSPKVLPLQTLLITVSLQYFNPSGHWPGDGISEDAPGIGIDLLIDPNPGLQIGSENDNQLEIARQFMSCLLPPG